MGERREIVCTIKWYQGKLDEEDGKKRLLYKQWY